MDKAKALEELARLKDKLNETTEKALGVVDAAMDKLQGEVTEADVEEAMVVMAVRLTKIYKGLEAD